MKRLWCFFLGHDYGDKTGAWLDQEHNVWHYPCVRCGTVKEVPYL